MSRATALQLLYEMASDMTIANSFNYDWAVEKSGDLYFDADDTAVLTISLGDELNNNDVGGVGSSESIDVVEVVIQAKGVIGGTVDSSNILYEGQLVESRMRDDIVTRYDSPFYLCKNGLRAISLMLTGVEIQEEEEESRYTTNRILCRFDLRYKTNLKLMDM